MPQEATKQPVPFRRIHALANTFSGIAGEARLAAELVRCGCRVAKPYWADNETDLLILADQANRVIPLVLQVKAVQFLPNNKGKTPSRVFIQGLKKRYVEKNEFLLLAIYRVDTDEIFFIDGSNNIRAVYDSQHDWHKHIPYTDLQDDSDVRIGIDRASAIAGDWKVSRDDATWFSARIDRVARAASAAVSEVAALEGLWKHRDDDSNDEEPTEEPTPGSAPPGTEVDANAGEGA